MESCSHLIFSRPFSLAVWHRCCRWLCLSPPAASTPREHFLQFNVGWTKIQKRVTLSIWLAITWSIWLTRNKVVFCDGSTTLEEVFQLIIWRTWQWNKANLKEFHYSLFSGLLALCPVFLGCHSCWDAYVHHLVVMLLAS